MIVYNESGVTGEVLDQYKYIERRGLGRIVLPITRWMRATNALRYMKGGGDRHLDIGCGDGYFLRKSPYRERIGLDKRVGDEVSDTLPFDSEYFDCISMLAVLEHVQNPQAVFQEIHRTLKTNGLFVFTTPKESAEKFINLYVKHIDEEHEEYFDLVKVKSLADGLFDVKDYRTFVMGLNQVFCLRKK
jgi:SAM-dependent methyltransferase